MNLINNQKKQITKERKNNEIKYTNILKNIYVNEELESIIMQLETLESQTDDLKRSLELLKKEKTIINKKNNFYNNNESDDDYNNLILEELSVSESSNSNQIDTVINNYQQCIIKIDLLRKKKDYLINEQKKAINDIIIDKDGNTLGFDGLGRLIAIKNKFDDQINIEYANNANKIIRISSETQSIVFNYNDKTEVLDSILDSKGRITKYIYDSSNNLIDIIYNNGYKTSINKTDYDYEIVSSNLKKVKYSMDDDGYVTIFKYVHEGEISNIKIENSLIDKLVIKDFYDFDIDPDYTKITDIKGGNEIFNFNNDGQIIKRTYNNEIETINYEFDHILSYSRYKTNKVLKSLTSCLCDTTYTITNDVNEFLGLNFKVYEYDILSINIEVTLTYNDNQQKTIKYNQHDLYIQDIIIPLFDFEKEIKNISFRFTSSNNTISSLNVELIQLEDAITYTYDVKNRLIKMQNKDEEIYYSDFNDNDNALTIKTINKNNEELIKCCTYNENNLLTSTEDTKQNICEYYYDELGNCIEQRIYNKREASLNKIQKSNYDKQGRIVEIFGNIKDKNQEYPKQEISYIPRTNIKNKIKGFNKEIIVYNYDFNDDNLLSISSSANGINNSSTFTYNYNLLTSMKHHGLIVDYAYDGLDRITKVSLNGEEYVNYTYNDCNESDNANLLYGTITSATYRDGTTSQIIYNNDGDIYESQLTYKNANLVECELKTSFIRDENNNIRNIVYYKGNNQIGNEEFDYYKDKILQNYYKFDKDDNELLYIYYDLTTDELINYEVHYINDSLEGKVQYFYNQEKDIQKINITNIDDETIFENTYDYDVLKRINHQTTTTNNIEICHEYSYLQQDENTLDLIKEDITKISITNDNTKTYLIDTSNYNYDTNGNIIMIQTDDSIMKYRYDSLNRLIREDNQLMQKTYVFEYDKAGNIIYKKTYDYTIDDNLFSPIKIDEYIYNCVGYKDQLIGYNNQNITYDEMGRPIIFKDKSFKWNTLNQLEEIPELNVKYEYDNTGVRNKKIVNDKETTYTTEGNKIHQLKTSNYKLTFKYALNKLIGFVYNNGVNNKQYIYQTNIQGDITAIYDEDGNQVAEYIYDAYGNTKITINVNNIAEINPFRYRGYYYDEETNLFYCNSRYYSPELCRWISPDDIEYLDPESVNGLNLYCYRGKDSVNKYYHS